MGSPRFKLNRPDIGKVLLFALMVVGLAAAITYIVDHVAQLDLGSEPVKIADGRLLRYDLYELLPKKNRVWAELQAIAEEEPYFHSSRR